MLGGEVAEVTRDGDQRGAIVLSPLPRGRINQDISICENPTLYVNPCLREQQAQRAGWFCLTHNKNLKNSVKSNCKLESCCSPRDILSNPLIAPFPIPRRKFVWSPFEEILFWIAGIQKCVGLELDILSTHSFYCLTTMSDTVCW